MTDAAAKLAGIFPSTWAHAEEGEDVPDALTGGAIAPWQGMIMGTVSILAYTLFGLADTYALLLVKAGEALVIPALNRDGDCLSDLVLQMFGSIAGSESMRTLSSACTAAGTAAMAVSMSSR